MKLSAFIRTQASISLTCLALVVVTACAPIQRQTRHSTAPVKPVIQIEVMADGGMCLDRDETEKLGLYLIQVEQYIQEHETEH